jgi:hypothetical protein
MTVEEYFIRMDFISVLRKLNIIDMISWSEIEITLDYLK